MQGRYAYAAEDLQLEEKESQGASRPKLHSFMEDFNPSDSDFWNKVRLLPVHLLGNRV